MRKQTLFGLLGFCVTFSLVAAQTQPVFYFCGKRLFVGMPKAEAVTLLSTCCKLSPPADSENVKMSVDTGRLLGHFIFSNDESPQILGSIFFAGGKVVRITRPTDADKFNPVSDDVVAFARALDRSLAGSSDSPIVVSTRHDRSSNGEGEILTLSFPNGRAVELQISTLDTPSKLTGKRDAVSLDEVLEAPSK